MDFCFCELNVADDNFLRVSLNFLITLYYKVLSNSLSNLKNEVMEHRQTVPVKKIDTTALITKMGIGAVVGMAVICFFVFGVDHPDPSWGEYWRIRPLIVGPLAGAMGGALIY